MIDKMTLDALQLQFNKERANREQYRLLADNLENVNWAGAAQFMRSASNEEGNHADKFAAYIVDRGSAPRYDAINAPLVVSGEDMLPYFQAAHDLELSNTEAIKNLHYTAEQGEDTQTCIFLIWAIDEQTKAERELLDIIMMLQRLDNNGRVVFDKMLGG